ncbi:MAG: hypothetical protein GC159_23455 [Phycisphaera sp.]|nr:hypothetical protein [Phycisphaera sp.]
MNPARMEVVKTLNRQARTPRDMPLLSPDTRGLDARDAQLAMAIHRTTLQRWLTIEYLLGGLLKRQPRSMQPKLQAILLSAGAQLIFMEKMPPHAVVHDSVEITKQLVGTGASKLTNAVLRRASELVVERIDDGGWQPARNRVPWRSGYMKLRGDLLPDVTDMNFHLGVATSHPRQLVHAWVEHFGKKDATRLFLHSLTNPPIIVHAPDVDAEAIDPALAEHLTPHASAGFFVWRGDGAALRAFLDASPTRWVQDPASSIPVTATADLKPALILDLCAGLGTKTRQLAAMHPDARIVATDVNEQRYAQLAETFAEHPRVDVVPFDRIHEHNGAVDLLAIDAPCSNTGTLARRPEARYRYQDKSLNSVLDLQRGIIDDALPLLKTGGAMLYSTCSIEPAENEVQAAHAAQQLNGAVVDQSTTLPGGSDDTSYHDGSYYALIR